MSTPIKRDDLGTDIDQCVAGFTYDLRAALRYEFAPTPVFPVWVTRNQVYSEDPRLNPKAEPRQDHKAPVYETEAEAWEACMFAVGEWFLIRNTVLKGMWLGAFNGGGSDA